MSETNDPSEAAERGWQSELPCFPLSYRFDDPHEPATVTVYDPAAAELTTSWISADATVAVSLDEIV